MKEIVEELLKTVKYIPLHERNSRWYREYLDKVNNDLKAELNGKG